MARKCNFLDGVVKVSAMIFKFRCFFSLFLFVKWKNFMQNSSLAYSTERTNIYYLTEEMLEPFYDYIIRNKEYLQPFEPLRDANYYTKQATLQRIKTAMDNEKHQLGVSLVFTMKNSNQIIGNINFSNFIFGVFQACYLGYSIDESYQGQGLMTEVLNESLVYIHQKYKLRRFMANYLPNNKASERVLTKLRFEKEGYAKSYLKINGEWQDHVLMAYVFE